MNDFRFSRKIHCRLDSHHSMLIKIYNSNKFQLRAGLFLHNPSTLRHLIDKALIHSCVLRFPGDNFLGIMWFGPKWETNRAHRWEIFHFFSWRNIYIYMVYIQRRQQVGGQGDGPLTSKLWFFWNVLSCFYISFSYSKC